MQLPCILRAAAACAALTLFIPACAARALPFEKQYSELREHLKGKRVGLLTNPTAVDKQYTLIADRLIRDPEVELVCFFAPEHGLRDDRQAGVKIDDYVDEATGVPVYSVYGARRAPEPEQLAQLDTLVCDMQDVGARFYTRIWTMTRAMEAAAKAGKECVVFDRPNPVGLSRMEGPPITFDAGLIGQVWPGQPFGVPTRHGMTVGEVLTLVNEEWAEPKVKLTVIRVPGYTRRMTFKETGYPWVMPSPNMPTIDTATVYTGTCVFEGTNLSEGRGTTKPFELIGAPFVDAEEFARRLNESGLEGVRFRPAWFTPTFDDFEGQRCAGVQLHVTDRGTFEPVRTGLVMLKLVCEMYPGEVKITTFASRLTGIADLDKRIRTESVDDLVASWQDDLKAFDAMRRPHLLYP
jgi:uncharacterized protein YbbC (DUF1343 family)